MGPADTSTFRWLVVPVVQALTAGDPEEGHKLAVKALSKGLTPVDLGKDDDSLAFQVCLCLLLSMAWCVGLPPNIAHIFNPFIFISSGIGTSRTQSV
jgi:hypothetical protein